MICFELRLEPLRLILAGVLLVIAWIAR